jgi:tRNA threonylcarbamoyladenosine biosynthesis protein TsaE
MQNNKQEFSFQTTSPEQTTRLGEQFGSALCGGEIIELSSDVGGGKTTLTKGIVRGIGCADVVTSPTFTVAKEYQGSRVRLFHYDFYRLSEPGVVGHELSEVLQEKDHVVVIEWSAIAEPLFADKPVIRVELARDARDEQTRLVTIAVPGEYAELIKCFKEYA